MTEAQKQEIPPTTDSIIAEINRENMSWEAALGDLLDNSLDASATRVVIRVDKQAKRVSVIDNGEGCAEPHRMLQSGYTTKRNKKNQLGRYGVGLKHASFYFCGETGQTTILTSTEGSHRQVRVCWGDVVRSGKWEIDAVRSVDDQEAAHALPELRGTSVQFASVRSGFLSSLQLESMLASFEFVFSPALRDGRQIEFDIGGKRRVLAASRDPVWSESMEFDVQIGHRKARVRAGIKAKNDTSRRVGMSFGYGHRVIVKDSAYGLGDYSKEGFAGFVDLEEQWVLGANKLSVTDDAWVALCDEILEHVKPILEKLKQSTLDLQCEAIREGAADILTGITVGQVSGWHRKKGGPPRKFRPDEGKKDRVRGRAGSFRIHFYTMADDDRGGYVEASGTGFRVNLNDAKPGIAEAISRGDTVFIACVAWAFWCNADAAGQLFPQARPPVFEDLMGKFLTMPSTLTRIVAETKAS